MGEIGSETSRSISKQSPTRKSLFESGLAEFSLLRSPTSPAWRRPQLGALTAITSHWTLSPEERLLVSLPTGSGKTGVATALPHIARSRRVLVVAPSVELRKQLAEAFRHQRDLKRVGAISASCPRPVVQEVTGRDVDWERLAACDVVVSLPNSISPQHMSVDRLPSPDFFDLLIFDEAHHTPAATWLKLLEHFPRSRAVLLTATPRRTDGKLVPGTHAYHFPLRAAIDDGLFNTIRPVILEPSAPLTEANKDAQIADAVARTLATEEHRTSVGLIRVGTVHRATLMRAEYEARGVRAEIIIATTSQGERDSMLARWRAGELRALIAVDMLGEGIDVPRLRVVGYHDKHKSVPATMQFIGRLARTSADYPQESVLVTVHDEDVYPALQGALRELYREDADWVQVLPTLIDDEVQREQQDRAYLSAFEGAPVTLALRSVRPLARASMYEVPLGIEWAPDFSEGVPEGLRSGERFIGRDIVYSGLNELGTQFVLLTAEPTRPKWYAGPELRRDVYDLAVVSWIRSTDTTRAHLLFVNAQDAGLANAVRDTLDPTGVLRNGNPAFLQAAFDSLERLSVSSVGVRNTFAAVPGTPAYSTFAGSGIDRGLREADTNARSLGHAMAQVQVASGASTTAGLASEKAKYWETRYLGLREYDLFATELAARYWFPRTTESGPLLPNVSKGARTDAFPSSPIAAEISPALFGAAWTLPDGRPLEALDLRMSLVDTNDTTQLHMCLVDPTDPDVEIWVGRQTVDGRFTSVRGDSTLHRGTGHAAELAELFDTHPPLIYFLNGATVSGGTTFPATRTERYLPNIPLIETDWTGVDLTKETRRNGGEKSIHHWVETHLKERPVAKNVRQRWVFHNDGGGEIADHVVIEQSLGSRIRIELWHSKPSLSATPGVRVKDLEVVTQQAAKSRRHITDRGLWHRIARRLEGKESPPLTLLAGDLDGIRALCGLIESRTGESIANTPPLLDSKIVIVQPGLSAGRLRERLSSDPNDGGAGQVREFLTFLHNAVGGLSEVELYCSA